jgi:hypothetical protein
MTKSARSCRWRHHARLIVTASAVLVCLLLPAFECRGAEKRSIRLAYESFYQGEVEAKPSSSAPCNGHIYCDDRYCAHGFGSFDYESGLSYTGTFVHGCIDGSGTYETDVYTYVGGFKMGRFHGHGTMECIDLYHPWQSWRIEGEFVDGTFSGKPVDAWFGLCKQPR